MSCVTVLQAARCCTLCQHLHHSLSLLPQWAEQRSLHHHSEESWLLAAVWWRHRGGASPSRLLLVLWLMCLYFSTVVCFATKPRFAHVVQKIDAQAIEEFYGLTSDISKNSESGYILFYQSREWLEPDHWHRMRLHLEENLFFFSLSRTDSKLLPSPSHPAPILHVW